jgi:hypothetical protein
MRALRQRIAAGSLRPLLVVLILTGVWLARERQAVVERRAVREKLDRTLAATSPPARAHWRLIKEPTASPGFVASVRGWLGDEPLGQIRFPRTLSKGELEYLGKWFPEATIVVAMEVGPHYGHGPGRFHGAAGWRPYPPPRLKAG